VNRTRLDGLDALRGLAAMAVVVYHYAHRGPDLYPELGQVIKLTWWGQYGVHLFFVISGFVIFMTLGRATPRAFLVTRFIRLYPLYWLAVILTFVTVLTFGLPGREVSLGEAILNLSMLQAFVGVPHVDGAYWTLAAELMFYIQVGALYFLGFLHEPRLLPSLYSWSGLIVALALAAHSIGGPFQTILLIPGLRWLPLFIAGMALYLIHKGDRRLAVLGLPPLCAATMVVIENSETAVATGAAIVLIAIATHPRTSVRSWRWTRTLGAISYPLYLIHQNIGFVILMLLGSLNVGQAPAILATVVLVAGIALGLTRLADEPIRRYLRSRLLTHSGESPSRQ
jgi:peptidoglycan/LPS O-acetylase OafA/YrhL